MGWESSVPILVGLLGLTGALFGSLLTRRHDRQQQARALLLAPAEEFAAAALGALASLRYVTPPSRSTSEGVTHRNQFLLTDVETRDSRIAACHRALDAVRVERAKVRLVFHPKSWSAEWSRQVLAYLRHCIQDAERFYTEYDESIVTNDATWDRERYDVLRASYKTERKNAYDALDRFFDDVAGRLIRPTWDPKRIETARVGLRSELPSEEQ